VKDLSFSYQKAIIASIEASNVVMEFYERGCKSEYKTDGSPVTEADLASSRVIVEHLQETNIPILGEESEHPSFEVRKEWPSNWCVDPLDGTKEYIKRNGEFAVSIALIENTVSTFGVIAWPVAKKVIFGGNATGVFVSSFDSIHQPEFWEKLTSKMSANTPLIMASSRSPYSGASEEFINALRENHSEIEFLKKGSALKFFDLAYGYADVYPRFAPTMEWDIAAGQAILEALGGSVCDVATGNPLRYNKENLLNPHFIALTQPLVKN
jgi:3'(2'), 5'-bisphosphate nucleotidase